MRAGNHGPSPAVDVTIIIPNYNTIDYTLQCLRSILDRTGGSPFALLIVVVDNGSRHFDGAAIRRDFPQVEIVESERNLGFGGACNLGARGQNSRYLFFLNNDTQLLNDVVTILADHLEHHPEVGVCGAQQLDESLEPVTSHRVLPGLRRRRPPPLAALSTLDRDAGEVGSEALPAVEVESLSGADLLVRTELFREIGGFDERIFLYHEEDDLAARVRRRGKLLSLVPTARLQHFHGKSSPAKLSVFLEDSLSLLYFFEKHRGRLATCVLRVLLFLRFFVRWMKYRVRDLLGRDHRGFAAIYGRLVRWALAGFSEETVVLMREDQRPRDRRSVDRPPS